MSPQSHRRTFISYSRLNKEFALNLALELRSSGFDVWLDQLDIPTGSRWDDEVERALEESEIFMVILTPASSTSDNVKDEIGYAIDSGKRILPILLENAKVPLRLIRFQYVDFTKKSYEEGVESAKQLLRRLIEEPTIPRDQYPGAIEAPASEAYRPQEAPKESVPAPTSPMRQPEPRRRMDTVQITGVHNLKDKSVVERLEGETVSREPALVPVKGEIVSAVRARKSRLPLVLGTAGVGFIAIVAVAVFAVLNGFGGKIPNTGAPNNSLAAEGAGPSPIPVLVEVEPTNTLAPAQTEKVVEPTTVPDSPTPGLQKYFTEEFDGDIQAWPFFIAEDRASLNKPVITEEELNDVSVSATDSFYFFNIGRRQTYVYTLYDPFKYEDVRVDVRVDSRNINVNKASLICRYSPENGWYEFRVANNGPYGIYFAKPNESGLITYRTLADGNSTNTHPGNAVNEYGIVCQSDDTLSLYINGELARTTSDLFKVLRTGKVGVSISSVNNIPVQVGLDWIKISEPE